MPPLREREGDAVLIAKVVLDRLTLKSGHPEKRLSEDAMRAISSHAWPGNVRELENRLKRAALLAEGHFLTAAEAWFDQQRRASIIPYPAAGTGGT